MSGGSRPVAPRDGVARHAVGRSAGAGALRLEAGHGNAGALNLRAKRFEWLVAEGDGLLALSYRGFGGSSGRPSAFSQCA